MGGYCHALIPRWRSKPAWCFSGLAWVASMPWGQPAQPGSGSSGWGKIFAVRTPLGRVHALMDAQGLRKGLHRSMPA